MTGSEYCDDNQKKILGLIKLNPGINLSKISEISKLSVQLVDYHTKYLAHKNQIIIEKKSGYKRYYVKDQTGLKDKKFLEVLRQDIPYRIVRFLLENPNSQHKEILEHFEISKSTLSYHLDKLVKNEIIVVKKKGENKGYRVQDEDELYDFLLHYKPSKVLKRVKDAWDDFDLI